MRSNQNKPSIFILPYVETENGWTVSDEALKKVFLKMSQDGSVQTVFYDGKINSPDQLVEMFKSPLVHPLFIIVNGDVMGIAWLNGLSANSAFAHFCLFKESWGKYTEEMGKETLKYWFQFPGQDGPLFDVLMGLIPTFNQHAIKFIQKLGFVTLGEIPSVVSRHGEKCAATLSYILRK